MIEKTCTCTYVAGKLKTAEAPEGILRNLKTAETRTRPGMNDGRMSGRDSFR